MEAVVLAIVAGAGAEVDKINSRSGSVSDAVVTPGSNNVMATVCETVLNRSAMRNFLVGGDIRSSCCRPACISKSISDSTALGLRQDVAADRQASSVALAVDQGSR